MAKLEKQGNGHPTPEQGEKTSEFLQAWVNGLPPELKKPNRSFNPSIKRPKPNGHVVTREDLPRMIEEYEHRKLREPNNPYVRRPQARKAEEREKAQEVLDRIVEEARRKEPKLLRRL